MKVLVITIIMYYVFGYNDDYLSKQEERILKELRKTLTKLRLNKKKINIDLDLVRSRIIKIRNKNIQFFSSLQRNMINDIMYTNYINTINTPAAPPINSLTINNIKTRKLRNTKLHNII